MVAALLESNNGETQPFKRINIFNSTSKNSFSGRLDSWCDLHDLC
jgi:hypothetical protein